MEMDEDETIGDGAFEDYYGVRCGWDALAGQVQGGREVQEGAGEGRRSALTSRYLPGIPTRRYLRHGDWQR